MSFSTRFLLLSGLVVSGKPSNCVVQWTKLYHTFSFLQKRLCPKKCRKVCTILIDLQS